MLTIREIRIENLPQGCVTDRRPYISFSLESDRQGETLEKAVISDGEWTAVVSDQLNIEYGGKMEAFSQRTIRITATGKSGDIAESSASFCFGRLDTPWKASWITDAAYTFSKKESPRPMLFRRRFCTGKAVKRAWINATALGIYDISMNGDRISDDYFAPGFTSYAHQLQYQTYDIMPYLKDSNDLQILVAGGWAVGVFTIQRKSQISSEKQALLCEIHLQYDDGTEEVIGTDETWQVTEDTPYYSAQWYDGEEYDANVSTEAVSWKNAALFKPRHKPVLLAQYGSPVKKFQEMKPVAQTLAPDGEIIYDFGQNFAGVIRFEIKNASAGQRVVFRHAEVLVDEKLFTKPLRNAKATVTYICKEGTQEYSPRFTYMGFRYVGMRGIAPEDVRISAYVLHSDIPTVGSFRCSDPLINRLQENICWSGWSNFMDIPTDCPQRDERLGWTGDAAIFASTANFNFDLSRFWDKWLIDVASEQTRGGGIPWVVPAHGGSWPSFPTACWGDACVLVPWAEYLARGDVDILRRNYPVMQRFLRAVKRNAALFSFTKDSRYIWKFPFQFGDWCAPEGGLKEWTSKGAPIATAYFANSCKIAEKIARILGKEKDAAYYADLREKIVSAYRNVFTDGAGTLKEESQTCYVLPLAFDMTSQDETYTMAKNLSRLIRENGNKLSTGFPGTPYLLFALSDHGFVEDAYALLMQPECPGWLYEVLAGGTTIWERWDAMRPDGSVNLGNDDNSGDSDDGGMVSFNHYAYGAVGDWLYRRVAGIEPISGGYRSFRIAPMPGGGITEAEGTVNTPFGIAKVWWQLSGNEFTISVSVPVSTTCELTMPNGVKHHLESGVYQFSCEC